MKSSTREVSQLEVLAILDDWIETGEENIDYGNEDYIEFDRGQIEAYKRVKNRILYLSTQTQKRKDGTIIYPTP